MTIYKLRYATLGMWLNIRNTMYESLGKIQEMSDIQTRKIGFQTHFEKNGLKTDLWVRKPKSN